MLAVLLMVKFIFTMISYGSGVPGGIFLPLLVIGALTGDIYGRLIVDYLHVNPLYITNFVVFAMAAYFTAIVRAPITGSILITEMTGSFSHLLALITVSMTAYIVADLSNSKPIYDLLLRRVLSKHGRLNLIGALAGKKEIIEVDVCFGSQLDGKRVKDVLWPEHCLIVSIRRGDSEIIPKGNITIMSTDNIYALVEKGQLADVQKELMRLAGEPS